MAFAIRDSAQERAVGVREREDALGDVDVLVLVPATDVVDLALSAFA